MEAAAAAACPRTANPAAPDDAGSADARSIQPIDPAAGLNRRLTNGPDCESLADADPVRFTGQQEPDGPPRSEHSVQSHSELPTSGGDGRWSSDAGTTATAASTPRSTETQPESLLTPISTAAIPSRNDARIAGQPIWTGPVRSATIGGNARPKLHSPLAADAAVRGSSKSHSNAEPQPCLLRPTHAEPTNGHADQPGYSVRAGSRNAAATVLGPSPANRLRPSGRSVRTCANIPIHLTPIGWVQHASAARRQPPAAGSTSATASSDTGTWSNHAAAAAAIASTDAAPIAVRR